MARPMSAPFAFLVLLLVTSTLQAAPPAVRLEKVVGGLTHPTNLVSDGSTDRLYVTEQRGLIRLIKDGQIDSKKTPFLDIKSEVFDQGECGLLGLAFHPKFAEKGLFYVDYTSKRPNLKTIIAEFRASPGSLRAEPGSERVVLTIDQPQANHNGGQLQFGPDGMLYIGMGDGGAANDTAKGHHEPGGNAQYLATMLGKILRIDVTPRDAYAVPKDNPFVSNPPVPDARPEIWCFGIRNAWRFSFDRKTGDMWCGDIGQDTWEELDLIVKGGNYGWRPREGFHATPKIQPPEEPKYSAAIDPVLEYKHLDRNVSVTGGYVYRGKAMPELVGYYVYGDYASGRIWAMKYENGKVTENVELYHDWGLTPSSFGEDASGELYVCAHEPGVVYRIVAK
jgi:glucose/arabinose dehydrogenase